MWARPLRARVAGGALAALLVSKDAAALDVELTGETVAQSYAVASPWEGSSLERRRLLQTVGFAMYRLQGDDGIAQGDYSFQLALRVDADFGQGDHLPDDRRDAETRWDRASGAYFVPGLSPAGLDLMYGYVEGRGLAGGWLGFRVGRQYTTDALGWWSFDGALLRLTTPWFLELEGFGGFEQRGGLPLSTGRFEAQGMWRGRGVGFDGLGEPPSTAYPGFQEAGVAPALGVALSLSGPRWIQAKATYRRVWNTSGATTTPFGPRDGSIDVVDDVRVSSERVGATLGLVESRLGAVRGALAYDLYAGLVSGARAGLEWYASERLTLGADVDHVVPVFDADSIFNWFSRGPSATATARASARIGASVELAGSGGVRSWSTDGAPDDFRARQCAALGRASDCAGALADPTGSALSAVSRDEDARATDTQFDGLGQLSARHVGSLGRLELRGLAQGGARARQLGVELAGERTLDGGRYALGARVGVLDFADHRVDEGGSGTRGDRDATSFSYVLGAGFRPHHTTRLALEWEHDMNRLVGQRFRVLGSLELRWIQ